MLETYTVFFHFWCFPISLFQLVILIRFQSWVSLLLLILGYIIGFLFTNTLNLWETSTKYSYVIQFFIKEFDGCEYTRYSVQDFLDKSALEKAEMDRIDQLFVKLGFKVDIDSIIEIWVVKKGSSEFYPSQLVTYPILGSASYIFLPDEPDKIKGVGKFYIYHEIGHTLLNAAIPKFRLLIGNKSLFFFLFWSIWTTNYTFQAVLIAASLVMTMITMKRELENRLETSRLEDEVSADVFAIQSLPEADRVGVSRAFSLYPSLLRDSSMNEFQNKLRFERLNQNFALANESNFEQINNLTQIYAPLEILTSGILVSVLGTFGREPSVDLFFRLCIVQLFPTLIILIFTIFIYILFRHRIDNELTTNGEIREEILTSIEKWDSKVNNSISKAVKKTWINAFKEYKRSLPDERSDDDICNP